MTTAPWQSHRPSSCSLTWISLHEDPPTFASTIFFHLETRLQAQMQKPWQSCLEFGIPTIPLFGPIWGGQRRRAERGRGFWATKPPAPIVPSVGSLSPLSEVAGPLTPSARPSVFERLGHPLCIMLWEGYLGSLRQRAGQLDALSAGLNIRQEKSQPVLKPSPWWQTFK